MDHFPTHGTNIKVINRPFRGRNYNFKLRDTPGMEKYLEF